LSLPIQPTPSSSRSPTPAERWQSALALIRAWIPEREYHNWFASTRLLSKEADFVRIQVPNATFAKQLEGPYRQCVLGAIHAVGCQIASVHCEVREIPGPWPRPPEVAHPAPTAAMHLSPLHI